MTLAELNAKAKLALDDSNPDTCVNLIAEFTELFAAWEAKHQTELNQPDFVRANSSELKELADLYAHLLEKAEKLRQETSEELKKLKMLGKGLKAYVDILPKQVSTRRVKKW